MMCLIFLPLKLPECDIDLGMPVNTFIEIVKLCITLDAFSFDDDFYMQRFGMRMGCLCHPFK